MEDVDGLMVRMTPKEKIAQSHEVWKETASFPDNKKHIVSKALKEYLHGIRQIARAFEGSFACEMAKHTNEIQKFFIENARLGIPVLGPEECLHGVMKPETISFPHPNPDLFN